jgi:hypothetical protein
MIDLNNVSTVTKLGAANRQLCTAVRLFFDEGDPIAIHTLACAAREIYEQHCGKAGVERMLDHIKASNPSHDQKQIMKALNCARNFFKHPGDSLSDKIEFSDEMNDFVLFAACYDCLMLCKPRQPPEAQAYSLWFLAVKPQPLREHSSDATEIEREHRVAKQLEELDAYWPGLRGATRAEQKRAGRSFLDDAQQMV